MNNRRYTVLGVLGATLLIVALMNVSWAQRKPASKNKPAGEVLTPLRGGYRRFMKVTTTSRGGGVNTTTTKGEERYFVFQEPTNTPSGAKVWVAEQTDETEAGKFTTRTFISYGSDGTTRIHGGVKMDGSKWWVANAKGYVTERPGRLTIDMTYPGYIGSDGGAGFIFRVVDKEPIIVPAGEFQAYRCEGVLGKFESPDGSTKQVRETHWISPKVGTVKIVFVTVSKGADFEIVTTTETEATKIVPGK